MHGRNDGRLWHDSRGYHSLPFSRRIGTKKTYIVAVSAGTNHCMAINVGGTMAIQASGDLDLSNNVGVTAQTLVMKGAMNVRGGKVKTTGAITIEG